MAQQIINIGAVGNDPNADTIRAAYAKVNANDTELYGFADNIAIRKNFLYERTYTTAQIVAAINGLPAYTVTEKQSVWFYGTELIPADEPGFIPAVVKYKMMGKGKGVYGVGGVQLTAANLELVYSNAASLGDIESDPNTDIINFTLGVGQSISQWLNTRNPALTIQPQDEGYTLFKGVDASAVAVSYLWVGAGGLYGVGQTQSTAVDFQELSDEGAPPAATPPYNATLVQNNVTEIPAIHKDPASDAQTEYSHGMKHVGDNGIGVLVKFAEPTTPDLTLTLPAITADDTIATVNTQAALLANKANLVDGKIPAGELPSYVDDVLDFANLAAFPATGETSKIYIANDTNLTYRWSGSAYVNISQSLALGETSATAYRGDRGKVAYDHSQTFSGNPHGTTIGDIADLSGILVNKISQSQAEIKAVATGTNTLTATIAPAITAYNDGDVFYIKAAANNTAPITLNLNGLGAKNVFLNGTTIAPDIFVTGHWYALQYSASTGRFDVINNLSAVLTGLVRVVASAGPHAAVVGAVDGTTEKILAAIFMPAGTFQAGAFISVESMWSSVAGATTKSQRVRFNTTNSLTGSVLLASGGMANTAQFNTFDRRKLALMASNVILSFPVGSSSSIDQTAGTATAIASTPYNPATGYWWFITGIVNDVADQMTLESYSITTTK